MTLVSSTGTSIDPQQRRYKPRYLQLAFGGAVIVIIISLAAGFLWHLRTATVARAHAELSNLSAVLAEQTVRTLHSVDLVLGSIEERFTAYGNADEN